MDEAALPLTGTARWTPPTWRSLPIVWSNCLAGAWLGGYWPGAQRRGRLIISVLVANVLFAALVYRRDRLYNRTFAGWAWIAGLPVVLYPLVSAMSGQPALAAATGEGFLVGAYLFGSSYLGRGEFATDARPARWAWLLIIMPVVVNAVLAARLGLGNAIVVALPIFWLGRIAFGRTAPLGLSRGAALCAGTVLTDLSALVACTTFLPWLGWFAILFVLALVGERLAPAD